MTVKNGKPCHKCGTNEWYKDGHCVQCVKGRKQRHYKENAAAVKESVRRYRQANNAAENERKRIYRQANDALVKERKRLYQQSHSEADAAKTHRRRTRRTNAGGSFTASEFKELIHHYGNKCLCCGRTDVKLTADHIIPVSKGGTSNIENIQPLCQPCNTRKKDKTIDYRPDSGIGRWVQRKLFG